MPASAIEVRAAEASDLPPLAEFIARLNPQPSQQSLYCAARNAREVRATLRNAEDFPDGWERSFVCARTDGEITAALGCQFDPARTLGWLWGPWVSGGKESWNTVAPVLLDRLLNLLPGSVQNVEAFLHAENHDGLHFLRRQGFHAGPLTHIYVLPLASWSIRIPPTPDCPPLRPAHEVAFARLHANTFPAGSSTPADDLLAGRDDDNAIFAATDGLRLLGYVCVSINRAPREGFINYLTVKPTARGRGIGARLLQTAIQWTFEDKHLPQAALCVSEWRGNARRLYEQAGFTLSASGIGARRQVAPPSRS